MRDLGPLLQGQMKVAKIKSPYSLLIGPGDLQSETSLMEIMGWE